MSQLSWLADAVALAHAAFALFVTTGPFVLLAGQIAGLPAAGSRLLRAGLLASITFLVLRTTLGIACPLTYLENQLRDPTAPTAAWLPLAHRLAFRGSDPEAFHLRVVVWAGFTVAVCLLPTRQRGGSGSRFSFSRQE